MILILLIILFFFLMPLMVWQEDIFKVIFLEKYVNNNHEKGHQQINRSFEFNNLRKEVNN